MKKLILLSTIVAVLSGCASSADDVGNSKSQSAGAPSVQGKSVLQDNGSGSLKVAPSIEKESPNSVEAPNGYYENTRGNLVPSPYYQETKPAGASAKCRDGTYSFSQSRRGTCSHHGGVATWY